MSITLPRWDAGPSQLPSQLLLVPINPLRMGGILMKLQNVMKLTQKWKDFENNVTT
jgi:hypothetical protein